MTIRDMKRTMLLLAICFFAIVVSAQPKKGELLDPNSVKVDILPVNTVQSDFGPALIGDSLFFTSYNDALLDKSERKLRKKEFYDLFTASVLPNGDAKEQRNAIGEFVTRYHDGPIAWCAKTGELFITQSNYVDPNANFNPLRTNQINLRIVIAGKEGGAWAVKEEFVHNSKSYSVGHPAISVTGDTLIFASDMPGGFGATDLYMSIRKNGVWENPVNLGEQFNTTGKEEFPFLTEGGYLLFASNGREGLGGLDLYYTKLLNPQINHFGAPINSNMDDFSAAFPPTVEYAYMSSNRPGMGSDDIYKITYRRYMEYLLELSVLDAKTKRPINNASVKFKDGESKTTGTDGKVSRMIEREKEYGLTVTAFGYTDESKVVKSGNLKAGSVVRDTVWMNMIVKKAIKLENIYYDFDKWNILPESETELNKLVAFMQENPEVKVELASHTDCRGSNRYNQKLSEKRAQSAVDYIVSKGVSPDRITAKGYGEERLVNQCKNGVACTKAEHRLNRRTEFTVTGLE